ncbi:MAG: Holliday junction branch migration protein RuvA [Chitinophagales bacterium]|nr:Holliday junction branch migration protein RuvA [Bacteroidota bacterium]MCB9043856.1 Holliday junction branch migration protein RuvA [Chitinophagales bacterium]
MIAYIQGKLTYKSPAQVVIETNGIGYTLQISLHTYSQIEAAENCKLFTHYYLSGGAKSTEYIPTLYGFADEQEKIIFTELISVSGIGTNTARLMLSAMSPQDIQRAILGNNIKMLQAIKGVGPKSAQRLVLELKDKLHKIALPEANSAHVHNSFDEDALQALLALGISKNLALRSINKVHQDNKEINSVEILLKEALKNLQQ